MGNLAVWGKGLAIIPVHFYIGVTSGVRWVLGLRSLSSFVFVL